jgi:hypothetical protein
VMYGARSTLSGEPFFPHRSSAGFGYPLLPDGVLKRRFASLKFIQSLSHSGHFLGDLSQFSLVLYPLQMICTKLLSDVLFKLTPKEFAVWISPDSPLAILHFAGTYALKNKIPAHAVFLGGRYITKACAFTDPFAVFRHFSSL